MAGELPNAEREELRARIRASGLRSTPARLAVAEILMRTSQPLTHAEVARQLSNRGIDPATVYRNLTDLAERGLVSRIEVGDHVWRFEFRLPSAPREQHPHFVCVECGQVTCLKENPWPTGKGSRAKLPLPISEITEVLLKGRCRKCAAEG